MVERQVTVQLIAGWTGVRPRRPQIRRHQPRGGRGVGARGSVQTVTTYVEGRTTLFVHAGGEMEGIPHWPTGGSRCADALEAGH